MTDFIYHITKRSAWLAAQEGGIYRAESLAPAGFIHCSKIDQILRVANQLYNGQHGLVLLEIDPSQLKADLRWEPGADKPDELFPHIYGPIERGAVVRVLGFEPGPDGLFSLPGGLG
jgi:uncharacterized protein (DUF952 family)